MRGDPAAAIAPGRAFRERIDSAVFMAAPDFARVSLRLALPPGRGDEDLAREYLAEMARLAVENRAAQLRRMAPWRQAYRDLGLTESAVPPPEALLAWAARPEGVPRQGLLRDLVHGFLLCHGVPVAAYDLGRTSGDLWLRPSRGCELFLGLGEARPATPALGEVILADSADQVLARDWHGAQGADTAAGDATRDALVHIDLIGPDARDAERFAGAFLELAAAGVGAAGRAETLAFERPMVAWPRADSSP